MVYPSPASFSQAKAIKILNKHRDHLVHTQRTHWPNNSLTTLWARMVSKTGHSVNRADHSLIPTAQWLLWRWAHMQFRAARSLWTKWRLSRYAIPLAICSQIISNRCSSSPWVEWNITTYIIIWLAPYIDHNCTSMSACLPAHPRAWSVTLLFISNLVGMYFHCSFWQLSKWLHHSFWQSTKYRTRPNAKIVACAKYTARQMFSLFTIGSFRLLYIESQLLCL